jgi:hypothetical protein
MTTLHRLIIQTDVAIVLYQNVRSDSTIAITLTLPTMHTSSFMPNNKVPIFFNPSIYRPGSRGITCGVGMPIGCAVVMEYQVAIVLEQESPLIVVGDKPVAIL